MVEVFKTNVQEEDEAKQIIQYLLEHFPESKINFDLDDCDKILRIESEYINPAIIINTLKNKKIYCEIIE